MDETIFRILLLYAICLPTLVYCGPDIAPLFSGIKRYIRKKLRMKEADTETVGRKRIKGRFVGTLTITVNVPELKGMKPFPVIEKEWKEMGRVIKAMVQEFGSEYDITLEETENEITEEEEG